MLTIKSRIIISYLIVPEAVITISNVLVPGRVAYVAPDTNGWCAINTKWNKHQNCMCVDTNEDIAMCKKRCDTDDNCKGYTYRDYRTTCYVYTVSSCSNGCTRKKNGVVGDLIQNANSGSQESGCYIKKPSVTVLGSLAEGSVYQNFFLIIDSCNW